MAIEDEWLEEIGGITAGKMLRNSVELGGGWYIARLELKQLGPRN